MTTSPTIRRRTSIYVVELPADNLADKDFLLRDMTSRCTAEVAFALPTVHGVAMGFRVGSPEDAISIVRLVTDDNRATLHTGLGIHNRAIEIYGEA